MSLRIAGTVDIPDLLPARIITLPGRGEMFVRHFEHPDRSRPTLLLLHGWTASADLQFFTAYEALSREYSIIGVDHRGHGRGLRPNRPFSLEDCADDAAAVVRALGIEKVITVGYSMGGPVSFLVWRRHSELVEAMVFQATAMEWSASPADRMRWRVGRALGPLFRRLTTPRTLRYMVRRLIRRGHEMHRYVPWLIGEIRRNDPWMVSEAGRAIARFDARGFAAEVSVPTAMVLTTMDRLVPPSKQAALADAVRAEIVELAGDHFAPLVQPREYSDVTRRAVDLVVDRVQAEPSALEGR